MKFARLLLRLVLGGLFIGPGTPKLFGWVGGPGLDATAPGFGALGARPGPFDAIPASGTAAPRRPLLAPWHAARGHAREPPAGPDASEQGAGDPGRPQAAGD